MSRVLERLARSVRSFETAERRAGALCASRRIRRPLKASLLRRAARLRLM